MKRKFSKLKPPLSRRKTSNQITEDKTQNISQDEPVRAGDVGIESTKTAVSPKSKCYRTRHGNKNTQIAGSASSSNEDPNQTSAFDYNSEEEILAKNNEVLLRDKRKRESSRDEDQSTSLPCKSRYKKSQQAIDIIKKSDERETKNRKKRKGRTVTHKSSSSSDEQDFDKPAKKSSCLLVPDIELVNFALAATQGVNKKAILNLKKSKRNISSEDQLSDENKVIDKSESEQKKFPKTVASLGDVDGDDERDDDDKDGNKDAGKVDDYKLENYHESITRLENEPKDNFAENSVAKIKCPVCSKVFGDSSEQSKINEHVNSCLDGIGNNDIGTTENSSKSSLSMLQVQLVAFEYHQKERQECKDVFDGDQDGLFFCQICQKNLTKMNSQRRQQHINKCCDEIEKSKQEENEGQGTRNDAKKDVLSCAFCNMEFKSRKSWQAHIKKCAQNNNVPANQLLEIVKQQDQLQQETEATRRQTEERTNSGGNLETKRMPTRAKKKQKVAHDLRNVDEETQLAMALSASVAPPPPHQNDGASKPKRKRKKNNEVIPALLLRSNEETQNVIAARAAQVVCSKDDDSDEDTISCTPALAPSSLAKQLLKVEKVDANVHIVKEKSNAQATEKAKATPADNTNQDKGKTTEKDCLYTHDMSTSCGDTTLISLADMLASPDMCRSFLSFLDVADEETTTKEPNKEMQPPFNVKVGQSAPLWCMASLENKQSSINDFYVRGLLPVQLPKQPKKTPRKSSSTREQRLSERSEVQERLNKNATKKSEEFNYDNHEGSLEKPNKTMSESEITSASQADNVDILLELASGDDDDDDDDDQSLRTQRKSSVDHDDDEVFPSSGFCLPVGPNNLEKEVHGDHNIPSSLSAFLQDMSKMVGNRLLSDVMIVTKDNENIPAHSFMLASRSEILADMISNARITTDGLQSDNKPVCLTFNDVEANALRCILHYVYTASVHVPQPCLDDVIDLAERLKLFELVKACKDSKTSGEKRQEKAGNEEQEEEESSSVRCSLSAEELLDALWQGETESFETNKDNQTQSQEEWGEGFDDDDIEEVRIFQTQAAHRRRCNDDTRQETLEEILGLNEQDEEMDIQEDMEGPNETITEKTITVNADEDLLMEVSDGTCEGLQCEKKESNFVCAIEGDEAQLKECTETSKEKNVLDITDIPLEKVQPGNELEEKENEDCEAKELELNNKDRIAGVGHSMRKDKQCGFRKHDVNVDENSDLEKGNTSAQRRNPEKRDTYSDECDKRRAKEPSSLSDIQTADSQDLGRLRSSSDDDMSKNMVDKVDLTEDDSHDEDYETTREAGQDGSKREPDKYKSIDEDEDDRYRSIAESEDEHADDVAILDESISLLSDDNECVSPEKLPDNVLIIPETPHPKRKQKTQTTPEDTNVQHPSQVVRECSSAVSGSPSRRSDNVSCDNFNENEKDHVSEDEDAFLDKLRSRINAKAKNSGKEKKKRRGREKKTKKCSSRNEKSVKALSNESEYSSSPSRFQNSFSSSRNHASASNVDVVDLSVENEIEDLTSENASNHFEAGSENEMVDLERNIDDGERRISNDDDGVRFCSSLSPLRMLSPRVESTSTPFGALSENQELDLEVNIPDIQKSTSHEDDERSCSSLSPPRMLSPRVEKSSSAHFEAFFSENEEIDLERKSLDRNRSRRDNERSCSSLSLPGMLSPRVPSPCYSDFEPELPSPVESPVRGVNQDFGIEESKSYTNVNQSPSDTPSARRQLSAKMHSEEASKPKVDSVTVEEEGNIMEARVSSDSTHLKEQQDAMDTDHESENSDIISLLPVETSDTQEKTKGAENEPGEIEETAGKIRETFKATTRRGVSGRINTKLSLFKRLEAAKYGLERTETEGSSDVESIESGLDDTPRKHQSSSPIRSQESTNRKSTNARILDQNEFYDDGGFNCDVGDFGACFDDDDSFMVRADEQVELSEKQDEPDEQEKPDCRVQLREPRTPALTQRRKTGTPRKREHQDVSIASPITPMPDYDNMTTPDLKNEVKKFGVRPLPKKKMIAKLSEIYHYTHPGASAHAQSKQETSKEKASSRTTKEPSSKERKGHARTTKAPLQTASASQPTKQPAKKKKGPASQIRESSDSDDDGPLSVRPSSQRPASIKPSTDKTNKTSKKKLPSPIESAPSISSRFSSSQPVASSQRLKNNKIESTSSMFDDDKDTKQHGSDDSNDDEKEFGEVSILIDNEPMTASQQVVSDKLENRLLSYVESNQDIYLKVLNYQPIDLMALHELIKCNGIKCRVGELVDFLDSQCITFTTAGHNPRQRRKPTRRKKK